MKYIILFLSCYTCFGQVGFGHFSDEPYLAGLPIAGTNDVFLWVDAADALTTNAPSRLNSDIVTNYIDKGFAHWPIFIAFGASQHTRYYTDGSDGLPNGIPFIQQTNQVNGTSSGFGLPAQWMQATDTNWTILLVCKYDKSGVPIPFVYGEDGTSGNPSAYIFPFNAAPGGLQTATVDSASPPGTFTTHVWYALSFVQSNGYMFTYTNYNLVNTAGPSLARAIGYFSFASRPYFFGLSYTGASDWDGSWTRAKMWRRALFGNELTNEITSGLASAGLVGIIQPPRGIIGFAGIGGTLSVNSPNASSYQWAKNGVDIGGATTSSYTPATAATSDTADYTVRLVSPQGMTVTSGVATVAIVSTTVVSNWCCNVTTNGGQSAFPSAVTVSAINTLWNGFVTDGVDTKIVQMNPYATDNLAAATTPLKGAVGAVWTNHNFVAGDLTVNGLKGNTTTKYLDTGLKASTFTQNDTALFSYVVDVGTASGVDMCGQTSGSANCLQLVTDLSGSTFSDQYNVTAGQGRCSSATHGTGYYCGSRTGAAVHNLYYAKVGTAHSSISSTVTTGGTLASATFNVYAFTINNGGSTTAFSDSRYAAMGLCSGLTSTDSSNIYNRLVTFRTAVGGTNP